MAEEMTIRIPVGDWHAETLRLETPIASRDDVLKAVDAGIHTAQIARMAVVCREMGLAPADLMRPNKLLLHSGAREDISRVVRGARHAVKVKGATYHAPSYIGPVSKAPTEDDAAPDDDTQTTFQTVAEMPTAPEPEQPTVYVKHTNPQAAQIATRYLLERVPGHIWPRLLTIHENGGDVSAVVKALKAVLDGLVDRLE